MKQTMAISSLRHTLLVMTTGVLSLLLIFVIVIMSMSFINSAKNNIEQNVKHRVDIIAARSIKYLKNNDHEGLHDLLQQITLLPYVNYIHIYRQQDKNKTIEFFTSYKRKLDFPAIPDKINNIKALSKAHFSDNYLELILPILEGQQRIGYVYIRSSIEQYKQLSRNIIFTALLMVFFMVIISLILALKLHKIISQPIETLVETVRNVSQGKDYSLRCDPMPFQELDILAHNINTMFNRTEKHISKQDSSEQQVLKLNQELEHKVNVRTEALKESNQELLSTLEKLHQFQGQLVESEKMASLGDMVAGVAHEVNTPIGLGVTASSLLSDKLISIKQAFDEKTLKSSQLKRFLCEGEENVGIISRNLNRAADLISNFKKVAVVQSSEQDKTFNVKQLIDEVFLSLEPQLKDKTFEVVLDCHEQLVIASRPGPINQILINLVLNSISHGFEGMTKGVISISVSQSSGQLHINYCDNGMGVPEEIKTKIFDPFITTKRGAGGSGLGLHLVYNLVTQALDGNIQFEPGAEHGVCFDIHFPLSTINIEKLGD
jgi:signal transduction histidine kinase